MKRKSVTYLNELKNDLGRVLEEIRELTFDIEEAGSDLSSLSVHDFVTNDAECKFYFDDLVKKNRDLTKLFTSFRKARTAYLEFF